MALVAVALALVAASAGSAAARAPGTPHQIHGIQRTVCRAGVIEGWPGGQALADVAPHALVHFYSLLAGYALVTQSHPTLVRGYLRRSSLCPIDDHHRAVVDRDSRRPPPDHIHGSIPLARPVWVRICSASTWLRDVPLNRPRRLVLQGDAFLARARSHSRWLGGRAYGHAAAAGWIPETSVCHGLSSAPPEERVVADGPAKLLAPNAVIACGVSTSGRPAIVVGAFGTPPGASFSPVLTGGPTGFGEPRLAGRGWDLAGLGPVTCGRDYTLTYVGSGPGARTLAVSFAVGPPARRPPAAHVADACGAPAGKAYAHSVDPPVDHRYHARPAISGDGSRVAYAVISHGRRLVLDDNGAVRVVAPPAGRFLDEPALSGDGRVLGAQAVGRGGREIITITGGRTRVIAASGANPTLDTDGGEVAFEGPAGVFVAGGGAARLLISGGYRPALSGDGRFVVAEVAGPTGWQIVRADVQTGAIVLVSVALRGGPGRGDSLAASIDSDGGAVAFQSNADDLARGLGRTLRNVFVRRIAAGQTVVVSVNRCGGPSDGYSRYPSISGDGRVVAFDSHARNLVGSDTAGEGNVFVRAIPAGATRLISRRPDGRPSALTSFSPALSADGRAVAYASYAADLTTRPPPRGPGIRVYSSSVEGQRTRYLGQAGAEAAAVLSPSRSGPSVVGPFGAVALVPRLQGSCAAGLRIATAIRLSGRALRRPVRGVRVLLQPVGSERVIAQTTLPALARRQTAVLALARCRRVFLRYELFLGRVVRPHDHVSIRFLIDPATATVVLDPDRPEPA
ncbi:MAG: TolB protein [Solirubrobacteraceae bacterium]|nr:TolB protein [Solirubrobacteraceae bacterium]